MKVRPTGYHSTHIDVEEESPSYYITRDGELLSKKGYEPVPEEQWVDVTAECNIGNSNHSCIYHGEGASIHLQREDYRIRKVRADDVIAPKAKPLTCAFIIEKRTT